MLQEFKSFIMKGNVMDLAVGVIVGAAFGKIVSSLVDDIITPMLLSPALKAVGADDISKLTWNGIKYGNFLSSIITFLVISFVLFMVIKGFNKVNKPADAAPAGPSEVDLLTEIRDALRK
jgi:large conductance mechanosensitive channel